MKLQKRLAVLMAGTMLMTTAVPTMAHDYSNHWAKEAIERWSANGVVAGYEDGSFKPSQKVTRAELASFVARVFGLTDTSNAKTYDDVEAGKWYATAIATVSSAGLMQDDEANFRPNDFATREEAAHVLANAYELTGSSNVSFDDETLVSAWAEEQVDAMVKHGIIKGRDENNIAPQGSVTRAEVVTMLDRLTAEFYNVAGTYTTETTGNVVVNTKDVNLKDAVIEGNLYIAEGVGEGDVVLDNTIVKGKVIIEGGGENSIKFTNGSQAEEIKVEKADGKVRVFVDAASEVVNAVLESGAKIDGNMATVEVRTSETVQVLSGTIGKLEVSEVAQNATVTLAENVTVKEATFDAPVQVEGKGAIESAEVNVAGVELETQPENVTLEGDIEVSIGGTLLDQDEVDSDEDSKEESEDDEDEDDSDDDSDDNSDDGWEWEEDDDDDDIPYATISLREIVESEVARTETIYAVVELENATFLEDVEHMEDTTVNGSYEIEHVDKDTLIVTITGVNASRLPDAWKFRIPKEATTAGKDLYISVPIVHDVYVEATPGVILRSQFEEDSEVGARFRLHNTELTIESSKELAQNLKSNINGRRSVGIYNKQEFEVYYQTEGMNLEQLSSEWIMNIPANILATNEDVKIVVPIVEATPENVVQLAINKIPREIDMSIDREGDNVFAYLNKLAEVDKYPGMEIDFDFLYFQEWTHEETGEKWNWVEDDGTVNYDRGSFNTVGIQVNISYQGVEMQTKTGLTILDANEEPSVPNGTERLKTIAHGTTTSGALFVSEGEWVTFTVISDEINRDSVTTSSGLFVQDPKNKPILTKRNEAFEPLTTTPQVSRDGHRLTFKVLFKNVTAGARTDFHIPEGWFRDGQARQTELIVVKKSNAR